MLLLKNAQILNSDAVTEGDIRIRDGIIERIDTRIQADGAGIVLDLAGKWLIPGGIDPHVHLALPTPAGPSADDFLTGSKAALRGGTTHLIDFVTPLRGESLIKALEKRKNEAAECRCGIDFHMGITSWNPDTAEEMKQCVKAFGIRSFKAYLAYPESIGITLRELQHVMETAADLGAIVAVHCEDGRQIRQNQVQFLAEGRKSPAYHALSRPVELEAAAIEEVLQLCEQTGCTTYIVHVSSASGTAPIRKAREKGLPVYAETCPHYLVFEDTVYQGNDEDVLPFILSPPIRTAFDRDMLWEGLRDHTLSVVSTDHCPFTLAQKRIGQMDFTRIPNGTGGVAERLSLLFTFGVLTKKISPEHWVDLVATRAAGIFGLAGRKGSITEGKQADLVVWDPLHQQILTAGRYPSGCDHSIYEGRTLFGRAEQVICAGRMIKA